MAVMVVAAGREIDEHMSIDMKPGEAAAFQVTEEWLDGATAIRVSATCECGRRHTLVFSITDGWIQRKAEQICECGLTMAFSIQETH